MIMETMLQLLVARKRSPLHLPVGKAQWGHLRIVERLLKHGANVDSSSLGVHTPPYLAAEYGHEKIVKLLLEYGATIKSTDMNDNTILHLAVKKICSTIIEHTLKHCPDLDNKINSRVLNVAEWDFGIEYRKIVENLLQCDFTVNPKNANNFMYTAVMNGHMELVEELLKHGADVNMLCNSASGRGLGYPLHVATRLKWKKVAELLMSYGVDVNAPDEGGQTPICYATENAYLNMTQLFLANKANVNENSELLNDGVMEGDREIVKVLLHHGADVSSSNKYGRMPLHFIILDKGKKCLECPHCEDPAINVKREAAKLLPSRGANTNTRVQNCMLMLCAALRKDM